MDDQITPEPNQMTRVEKDFLDEVDAQFRVEQSGLGPAEAQVFSMMLFPVPELEPGLALEPAPEPEPGFW